MRKVIKLIVVMLLLQLSSSCFVNKEDEAILISYLKNRGIDLRDYEMTNQHDIKSYHVGFSDTMNPDSNKLMPIDVTGEGEYFFYTYEYLSDYYTIFHSEYFQINEVNYSLDSLLRKQDIPIYLPKKGDIIDGFHEYFYLVRSYTFEKDGMKYIIVTARNRMYCMNCEIETAFIIKIADDVDIKILYDIDMPFELWD